MLYIRLLCILHTISHVIIYISCMHDPFKILLCLLLKCLFCIYFPKLTSYFTSRSNSRLVWTRCICSPVERLTEIVSLFFHL